MKLSILIPTLQGREDMCLNLVDNFLTQIERVSSTDDVEVLTLFDNGEKTTGTKRNELIDMSKGQYFCFVDDDDKVSNKYVELLLEGIAKGVDCCSLKGIITWNGRDPEIFEHSLKYKEYKTVGNEVGKRFYERYPNHLNCVKKEVVKDIRYSDISFREDTDWATKIHEAEVLKTEHYIEQVLYHYLFNPHK
jgi:glycosyltransferase involved in cell wall biosynthesis